MAGDEVQIAEVRFDDLNLGTDRSERGNEGGAPGSNDALPYGDRRVVQSWLGTFDPVDLCRTLALYDRVSLGFLQWLECRSLTLGTLTASDLARFRDQLEGATATRSNRLAIVKSLLTHAHAVGHTPGNVGRAVRGPRVDVDADARSLSEAEVGLLIAVAETALQAERAKDRPRPRFLRAALTRVYLVRFMYLSGCRVSEVVSVRWGDLRARRDGDVQLSVMGKGRRRRTLPLPGPFVERLLLEYGPPEPEPTAPIFPFGVRRVQTIVAELVELSGLDPGISAHWLRHASASHALDRGAPAHIVQQSLGHHSLSTTSRYAHKREDGASKYLPPL